MSTKALKEALAYCLTLMEEPPAGISREETAIIGRARDELAAIEQAAKDLTRLDVEDFVYAVRDRGTTLRWADREGKNTWECPDVKAWSDASTLLSTIAKEGK